VFPGKKNKVLTISS